MNKLLTNSWKSSIAEEIKKIIEKNEIRSVKILSPYLSHNQLLSFMIDERISMELICDLSGENISSKGIDRQTIKLLAEQPYVKIWSNSNLHSKLIILDDKFCLIGSSNFTFHGLEKRIETMLITDEKEVVKESLKLFDELKANKELMNEFINNMPDTSNMKKEESVEIIEAYFECISEEEEEESNEKYGKIIEEYEKKYDYPKSKIIQFPVLDFADLKEQWSEVKKREKEEIVIKVIERTDGYLPTKNYKSDPEFGSALYMYFHRYLKDKINIKGYIADYVREEKMKALKEYVKNYNIEPKTGDYQRFMEYFEDKEEYKKEYEEIKKGFRILYSDFRKEYYLEVLKKRINEVKEFKKAKERYPTNYVRGNAIKNPEKKNEKDYYIESRLASFLDIKYRKWDTLPKEHKSLLEEAFPDYFPPPSARGAK